MLDRVGIRWASANLKGLGSEFLAAQRSSLSRRKLLRTAWPGGRSELVDFSGITEQAAQEIGRLGFSSPVAAISY